MSQELQLYSFEITKESIPEMDLYVFNLPAQLKVIMKKFKMPEKGYNLKLGDLQKMIQSLFPTVLYCHAKTDVIDYDLPWIYSTEKFDLRILKRYVRLWIDKQAVVKKIDISSLMIDEAWEWSKKINTRDLEVSDKGRDFSIIPGIFAYDFSNEEIYFESINKNLKFSVYYIDSNYTCISQPINVVKGYVFSYAINFNVVTHRDFVGKKFINIDISIKSWHTDPLIKDGECFLRSGGKSIFISLENPYINYNEKLYVHLKIDRDNEKSGKWKDFNDSCFNEVLDNKEAKEALNVNEILKDPKKYMEGYKGVTVFITRSLKDGNTIKMTMPGVGLPTRKELFYIFKARYEKLVPREIIHEVEINNFIKMGTIENVIGTQYDEALVNMKQSIHLNAPYLPGAPKKIYFEIYSNDKDIAPKIIAQTQIILRLEKIGAYLYKSTQQDFKLEFIIKDGSKITSELDDTTKSAKLKRIAEVKELMGETLERSFPILAFVEIPKFQEVKDEKIKALDPISAVRIGMQEKGRLTQFSNGLGEEKDLKADLAKINNCLLDILSDAGFQEDNFKVLGLEDKILIGVTYISEILKNIYVISKIENGISYIKFYGESKWRLLSDSLLSIDEERLKKAEIKGYNKKFAFTQWIEAEIQEVLKNTDKIVYLYGNAALRNNEWSFMGNSKMNIEDLKLLDAHKFRAIRINDTQEIPGYYIDEPGMSNLEKGYKDFFSRVSNSAIEYKIKNMSDTEITIQEVGVSVKIQSEFLNKMETEGLTEINLTKAGIKNQIYFLISTIKIEGKVYPVVYRMSGYKNEIIFYKEAYDKKKKRSGKQIPKIIEKISRDVFIEENEMQNLERENFKMWLRVLLEETNNNYDEDVYVLCSSDLYWMIKEIIIEKKIGRFKRQKWTEETNEIMVWELTKYDEYRPNKSNPRGKIPELLIDNRNQGLFTNNYHTFYGVGQRPDTMKSAAVSAIKESVPGKPLGKQRIIEMTIVGTEDKEELLEIGEMSHNLRKLNLTFPFHTQMPLPLFIIDKHKKYIKALERLNKKENVEVAESEEN